jgi:ribosomal protein S18 acetylase RimI-like enzyme
MESIDGSTMVEIRVYRNEDFEKVVALHRKALEAIGMYRGEGPWDDDLPFLETIYGGNHGFFLVGEEGGRIVAMGAFRKTTDQLAEIKRMRVDPGYQGTGLAKRLYMKLEEEAVSRGFGKFHLETSEPQMAARKFYQKVGFRETGTAMIDGTLSVLMEKDLPQK